MVFKVPKANVLRKHLSSKRFNGAWPLSIKEKCQTFLLYVVILLLLMMIKTSFNKLKVCSTGRETKGLILRHSYREIVSSNRLKAYYIILYNKQELNFYT